MEKKTINNIVKYGLMAAVIVGASSKTIYNKINNSEKVKEIKNDRKLRKQGIITVKYQEC